MKKGKKKKKKKEKRKKKGKRKKERKRKHVCECFVLISKQMPVRLVKQNPCSQGSARAKTEFFYPRTSFFYPRTPFSAVLL